MVLEKGLVVSVWGGAVEERGGIQHSSWNTFALPQDGTALPLKKTSRLQQSLESLELLRRVALFLLIFLFFLALALTLT